MIIKYLKKFLHFKKIWNYFYRWWVNNINNWVSRRSGICKIWRFNKKWSSMGDGTHNFRNGDVYHGQFKREIWMDLEKWILLKMIQMIEIIIKVIIWIILGMNNELEIRTKLYRGLEEWYLSWHRQTSVSKWWCMREKFWKSYHLRIRHNNVFGWT